MIPSAAPSTSNYARDTITTDAAFETYSIIVAILFMSLITC